MRAFFLSALRDFCAIFHAIRHLFRLLRHHAQQRRFLRLQDRVRRSDQLGEFRGAVTTGDVPRSCGQAELCASPTTPRQYASSVRTCAKQSTSSSIGPLGKSDRWLLRQAGWTPWYLLRESATMRRRFETVSAINPLGLAFVWSRNRTVQADRKSAHAIVLSQCGWVISADRSLR